MTRQEDRAEIQDYESHIQRLISLNLEYKSLIHTEESILNTLKTLESEATVLNAALRKVNTTREEKKERSLQQRQSEPINEFNRSLHLHQSDLDIDHQSIDDRIHLDADLKRLEDALFCDDLDMSSDDSSTSLDGEFFGPTKS
jgi:vacuolar-type H+-ATPase subunit I/STV1